MILEPTKETLKKYGINVEEWRNLLNIQNGVCAVCKKEPTKGKLCIDHEHVKGWKSMPPEQRKLYVRGLLCWFCNHYYLGRAINVQKALAVVEYLKRYGDSNVIKM